MCFYTYIQGGWIYIYIYAIICLYAHVHMFGLLGSDDIPQIAPVRSSPQDLLANFLQYDMSGSSTPFKVAPTETKHLLRLEVEKPGASVVLFPTSGTSRH